MPALALQIDPAAEHRLAAVQNVYRRRRALVDRQKRGLDLVLARLEGRPAHGTVLAFGTGMKRETARSPLDVGHRSRLVRGIVRHAWIGAAQFAGRPRTHSGQRILLAGRGAQEPLRMLLVQPSARHHALRFEPNQDLDAPRASVLADRPEAARESARIDLPRADLRPALLLDVPAGVHPPVVELQIFLQVPVDMHDLIPLVGLDHLFVGPRTGSHKLGRRQSAAWSRHGVCHHPAPPHVLCAEAVAAPEL